MSFTVLRNLFLLSMHLALYSKWTCGAHDTKKSSPLFHFIFPIIHLPLYILYCCIWGGNVYISRHPANYRAFSINRQGRLVTTALTVCR